MLKKIIGLGMIGGSLVFALLIIAQPQPITIKPIQLSSNPKTENVNEVAAVALQQTINLTQVVGETIGEGLTESVIEKNPEGAQIIEGREWVSVLEPEQLVEEYFTKAIQNFDIAQLKTPADDTRIKISADSSRVALETYLREFQTILKSNFSGLRIDYSQLTNQNIQELIAAYEQAAAEFYNLSVPQALASIHRHQITLMNGQRNVFLALQNRNTDPLMAVLAAQANLQLTQEFSVLQAALTEIIVKNNLNI